MKQIFSLLLAFFILTSNIYAAEKKPSAHAALNPYEQIMVGKVWITTDAVDQKGASVPAEDEKVAAFFGKAEYFPDHAFKMTALDGKPKMHGLWNMTADGKTRNLTVRDDTGKTRFTRKVENVKVTDGEYTYRIYPNSENESEYIDIIHKPQ